jgi:hypothetical protein
MTAGVRAGSSNDGYFVVAGSDRIGVDSTGRVNVPSTINSTSSSTGALTVSGGVGIAGNTNIAGNLGVGRTAGARIDTLGSMVNRSTSDGYTYFSTFNNAEPFGTNYDRFEMRFDPSSQLFTMGTANGGSGQARALAFMAGNTERMRIDTAGSVQMPFVPCSSRRLTSANVSAAQLIPWDTAITENRITYNTSTRRFTVPTAGRYRISFSGFKLNTAAAARVILGINTDTPDSTNNAGHTYTNGTTYLVLSFDVIVNLQANDYFTFRLTEGTLYTQPGDRFNFMAAHFLG